MVGGTLKVIDDMPVRKYGLIPGNRTALGIIGHMFLHGRWIHLLGNMFLLFICGPFLEDVRGRPLYGAFYLAAGLASVPRGPPSSLTQKDASTAPSPAGIP